MPRSSSRGRPDSVHDRSQLQRSSDMELTGDVHPQIIQVDVPTSTPPNPVFSSFSVHNSPFLPTAVSFPTRPSNPFLAYTYPQYQQPPAPQVHHAFIPNAFYPTPPTFGHPPPPPPPVVPNHHMNYANSNSGSVHRSTSHHIPIPSASLHRTSPQSEPLPHAYYTSHHFPPPPPISTFLTFLFAFTLTISSSKSRPIFPSCITTPFSSCA